MKKIILLLIVPTYIFSAEAPKPKSKISTVQAPLPPMQIMRDINPREFLVQLFLLIIDGEFLPGKFEIDLKRTLPDQNIPALLAKATEFYREMLHARIKHKAATSKSPSDWEKEAEAIRKKWGAQIHPLMTLYYTIYYQAKTLHEKTVEGLEKPEVLQIFMGIAPEVTALSDKGFLQLLAAFLMHGDLPENDAEQKLFVTELTEKLGAKETAQLLKQAQEFRHKLSETIVILPAPLFDEEPEEISAEDSVKLEKRKQIRKDWSKTTAPVINLYYTLYYTYKNQHPEQDYDIQDPESIHRWVNE